MTEVRARVRDRPVSNALCEQGRVDTGAEVEVENLQQQRQNTEMHFITSGGDFCQQKPPPPPRLISPLPDSDEWKRRGERSAPAVRTSCHHSRRLKAFAGLVSVKGEPANRGILQSVKSYWKRTDGGRGRVGAGCGVGGGLLDISHVVTRKSVFF